MVSGCQSTNEIVCRSQTYCIARFSYRKVDLQFQWTRCTGHHRDRLESRYGPETRSRAHYESCTQNSWCPQFLRNKGTSSYFIMLKRLQVLKAADQTPDWQNQNLKIKWKSPYYGQITIQYRYVNIDHVIIHDDRKNCERQRHHGSTGW